MLRRAEIQQRAAILVTGRLFTDERVDAEVALLVDARRVAGRQRRDPGRGRIDLPDRRCRDGNGFVERRRRFQETAELQRLQGRRGEVQQRQAWWRRQISGTGIGQGVRMTATASGTGSSIAADREGSHYRAIPENVVRGRPLVSLPASQKATVVEHVFRERVQGPIIALSRIAGLARNLDEAIVERQVVPDGVLPGGKLVVIIGEAGHDELADAAQRQLLLRRLQDRHGDESDVRVGWLYQGR